MPTPTPGPKPCSTDAVLCLDAGRFAVWAQWEDGAGQAGWAHAVPLTRDSGYFWFFEPGNAELAVKALDGCGINGRRWFFASGLTNLGVTVHVADLTSGVTRTYVNPPGKPFAPIADTAAFDSCQGEVGATNPEEPASDAQEFRRDRAIPAPSSPCPPDDFVLCVGGGRYRVAASWETASGRSGDAHAVAMTEESGYFWFFDPENVELLAKVLDACAIGQGQWFFAAGMTTVGVQVTVTDTLTGAVRVYGKPVGSLFAPVLDTGAFSFCPTPALPPNLSPTATPRATPRPGGPFITNTSTATPPRPSATRTRSPAPSTTPMTSPPVPSRTASPTSAASGTPTRSATRAPSGTRTPSPTRTSAPPTSTPTPTPSPMHHVNVFHRGFPWYAFVPSRLHVRVGDTVRWSLRDPLDHTLHATRALDGSWGSGPLGPSSFEHTFTVTGEFPYECGHDIHSPGTIIVDP